MDDDITLEIFLKQKLTNFILYLEKTIGTNNKLYPQILKMKNNETQLISYSEYLVKVAKKEKDEYYFEEATIIDYLENNGFTKKSLILLDEGNFINKLKRYLELFVNTIC